MICDDVSTKHRMSRTEVGGRAYQVLEESKNQGTKRLDLNGWNNQVYKNMKTEKKTE